MENEIQPYLFNKIENFPFWMLNIPILGILRAKFGVSARKVNEIQLLLSIYIDSLLLK